jgi:hypothetical protein
MRIDCNEDPGNKHMGLAPEAQEALAGHGLDRNGNPRGMVGQEGATRRSLISTSLRQRSASVAVSGRSAKAAMH